MRRALSAHQILEAPGFLAAAERMPQADVLVAEVSRPSHGVGWDVAWMLAKGRLAVLCCERGAHALLSNRLKGNPSPWQKILVYDSPSSLEGALRAALTPNG
jgi:hypothetical protein